MGMSLNAAEAVLLGFQHYLVMLGTTVIIPTALVPQMGGNNVRFEISLFIFCWLHGSKLSI
jgi:xanthine/uracil permease